MGFQINKEFVKTTHGMAMVGQVGFACIGGILGIFWGTGFLEFMFWSSFFVSLSLLLSHLVNATQSLETAFPWLIKVELGYALIWGCLTTLAAVLAFLFFGLYILPAVSDNSWMFKNATMALSAAKTTHIHTFIFPKALLGKKVFRRPRVILYKPFGP
ncbi:uncharacterized protein LOC131881929 [Tigriopus californicus]|uniref:uncharacterized protein LOC131881929 n=1 Tax=Tigriopus californicus TaxID=6832 RepID=UPI0027DA04F8|nr:uncharacterized protein LOC131881929 [Tigriopus californicus]XP_059084908.1 uncharacterized protein LOC131881929 [Tigriopus californicus]